MKLEDFAAGIAEICVHSPLAPGRPLRWIIIANPKAGGFTIPSRWKRHYRSLGEYVEKARANPRREDAAPARTAMDAEGGPLGGLVPTRYPGHARGIAEALLEEAAGVAAPGIVSAPGGATAPDAVSTPGASPARTAAPFFLVICAGGDGTSLDVLTALYHAGPAFRSNFAVLRLPMGTGNDGADAWELAGALDLLLYPTRVEYARALRLTTSAAGKGPFLAFNILSVGLDAFVTHMTNKMKGKLPGDSYKLWVDIASLLYDRLYKVGPMEIKVSGGDLPGGEERLLRETTLLLAVGATGHRTYGSHKRILPDDRNVCLVRQMPLLRKVALKGLFTTGTHIDKPESLLFNAGKVEFRGQHPILAQMDGETVLLALEDFPAAIELTEPAIPVLKRV
jgi:diacylglycerol kinase family enzyme